MSDYTPARFGAPITRERLQELVPTPLSADCPDCGRRCDSCGDRLCATDGPAPLPRCPAHPTCGPCGEPSGPACRDCRDAIREHNEGSDW